jgi:phosphoserine aminotransferase
LSRHSDCGGVAQFALVLMNLLRDQDTADYVETGYWSGRAIAEAHPAVVCREARKKRGP